MVKKSKEKKPPISPAVEETNRLEDLIIRAGFLPISLGALKKAHDRAVSAGATERQIHAAATSGLESFDIQRAAERSAPNPNLSIPSIIILNEW